MKLELSKSILILIALVGVLTFGIGYTVAKSGDSAAEAEVEKLRSKIAIAQQSFDPATAEIKGVITAVEGSTLTVSSLSSQNPLIDLPDTLTYTVSPQASVRQHGHKDGEALDQEYLKFYRAREQYVLDFLAGEATQDDIPQEPDIHEFTDGSLNDLRVGRYVAIGSTDGDSAIETGRLNATYVVYDDSPIQ